MSRSATNQKQAAVIIVDAPVQDGATQNELTRRLIEARAAHDRILLVIDDHTPHGAAATMGLFAEGDTRPTVQGGTAAPTPSPLKESITPGQARAFRKQEWGGSRKRK